MGSTEYHSKSLMTLPEESRGVKLKWNLSNNLNWSVDNHTDKSKTRLNWYTTLDTAYASDGFGLTGPGAG